jgi:hypothetical protein
MRKWGRVLSLAFVFGAFSVCLPGEASATSYEDAMTDCSYPKLFDLLFMRPLGTVALGVGALLWVPAAPVTLLCSPSDLPYVTGALVGEPLSFTVGRRLGECNAQTGF